MVLLLAPDTDALQVGIGASPSLCPYLFPLSAYPLRNRLVSAHNLTSIHGSLSGLKLTGGVQSQSMNFSRPCRLLKPDRSQVTPVCRSILFSVFVMLFIAKNVHGGIGDYLLNENFNSMTTNVAPTDDWISAAPSGSVQVRELPFAADKSVRIEKTASSTSATSLSRTLPNYSGKVVFEAKVMMRETTPFHVCPYIYDSSGTNPVVSIGFSNGNIVAYDQPSSSFQTVQSFVANDWYMIRVVINTATNTYDLFIDGVRKLNNAPVRNNSATVGKLSFYMDGSNVGTFYVDNVKIWELGDFIGAPPSPVFDVHDYGAVGDGSTNDTVAIQNAINACTGTGGSVYLSNGTFLTGTLYLQSNMTFFIDTSANLKASTNGDDFPKQSPPTTNNQLLNCRRAHLYAVSVINLKIDGGGTIDGSGTTGQTGGVSWTDGSLKEAERPISIWTVDSDQVTIQNIYIRLSAMWTIVPMETDDVLIKNVLLNVDLSPTRDGIDIVDCHHTVVQDCTVYTGDDSFCPKTGIRRGVDDLVIKNCFTAHTGANSYKFGTASYGGFSNALIQDCYAKNAQYAAMVVMSRNGADVSNINFSRIEFSNCGAAFFVFLGQQPGHPEGDVDKLGSIDNVHFTDILCSSNNTTSAIWGSLITGQIYNNVTYSITNLFFTNCNITFKGGLNSVPGDPPEWDSNQYPEANMWGNLPAYGYYMRHVQGVTFTTCTSRLNGSDVRPEKATNDVSNLLIRVDSDGDGLPDDWEQQYFGSATGADPNADTDGDGVSNYAEFVAGTNPLDPSDHLAPTSVSFDGTTVTLTFRTVPLKRYQLQYTDDLAGGIWTNLGNIRAADSNSLVVTDTPGAVVRRFYRLQVLID
jgi:Glycosyl hydrolases family 28/Bacterial TSP3 repeat